LAHTLDVLDQTLAPVDPEGCVGVEFRRFSDLEPALAARRMLIRQIEAARDGSEVKKWGLGLN
jgi:hypothetical protein